MNLSQGLKYLGGLIVLLLIFGSGWLMRDISANTNVESLLKNHTVVLQEIETTKTQQIGSLTKALAQAGDDQDILLDEIASLRSRPAEIRYITKIKTVVEGGATVVTTDLPKSHTFELEVGLPVAQFTVETGEETTYVFDTADLTLQADIVIGERDSALSLRASSDLEPGVEYELPVETFNVKYIREQALFEPHLLLGANIGAGQEGIAAGPHVASSFFHPTNRIDLLAIRAGINSTGSASRLSVGLDPVLYNVGDALPIFTNLWVGAGVSVDTTAAITGTISIGAKL